MVDILSRSGDNPGWPEGRTGAFWRKLRGGRTSDQDRRSPDPSYCIDGRKHLATLTIRLHTADNNKRIEIQVGVSMNIYVNSSM